MDNRNFRFVEITIAFLLGALLQDTAPTLIHKLSIFNYRAILLIVSLVILAEMYIVLFRYHQRLNAPYPAFLLFFDITIGLGLMTMIEMLRDWNDEAHARTSLVLAGLGFVALALRQAITYRMVDNIEAQLMEQKDIHKKDLLTPIVADIIAIPLCFCIYLSIKRTSFLTMGPIQWSWIAFCCCLLYFVLMYIWKPTIKVDLSRDTVG
jgi:hypothetical protein